MQPQRSLSLLLSLSLLATGCPGEDSGKVSKSGARPPGGEPQPVQQPMPTRAWNGIYEGEGLRLELVAAGSGFAGTLTKGEQRFDAPPELRAREAPYKGDPVGRAQPPPPPHEPPQRALQQCIEGRADLPRGRLLPRGETQVPQIRARHRGDAPDGVVAAAGDERRKATHAVTDERAGALVQAEAFPCFVAEAPVERRVDVFQHVAEAEFAAASPGAAVVEEHHGPAVAAQYLREVEVAFVARQAVQDDCDRARPGT